MKFPTKMYHIFNKLLNTQQTNLRNLFCIFLGMNHLNKFLHDEEI